MHDAESSVESSGTQSCALPKVMVMVHAVHDPHLTGAPKITAVIPTHTRIDLLRRALESLSKQANAAVAVVVIDNCSPHDVRASVSAEFPHAKVVRSPRNLFFAGAVNLGAALVRTPYLLVLNDDVVLDPAWAEAALAPLHGDPRIGSVASKLYQAGTPGLLSSAGDHLNLNGWAGNLGWGERDGALYDVSREVFSASGACALYRTCAFREAGGFDSRFTAYLEDVDLGFRLQLLGYRCVYAPGAVGVHVGGATYKARLRALALTERNMLWNITKNFPTSLLSKHRASIVKSQSLPAPITGGNHRFAWALGKAWAMPRLPELIRIRWEIQNRRRVSDDYVEGLLRSERVAACHL